MTLTDFLLARIAEDEAEVGEPFCDESVGPNGVGWAEVGAIREVLITSQRRVLAECEAKRRIVERFPDAAQDGDGWNEAGLQVLELLALPYADHPDYRDDWRP